MIDINELRRLAQAATPGPWKMLPVGDGMPRFAIADGDYLSILTIVEEGGRTFGVVYEDSDARYISAANPAAIVELLDRLEAAESAWKEADKSCRDLTEKVIPNIREQLESAEEERDRYKLAYNEWIAKTEWLRHEIACSSLPAKYLGMHRAEAIKLEIDRLRARVAEVAEMERQEPVAEWIENKFDQYPQLIWDEKYKAVVGTKLYALPGAKGEEK